MPLSVSPGVTTCWVVAGRVTTGAGGPAPCGGSGAGGADEELIRRTVPTGMMLGLAIEFSDTSDGTLTPYLAAMPVRFSPAVTRWVTSTGGGGAAAGISSDRPIGMTLGLPRWLAAAIACGVVAYRAAIVHRLSPAITVWLTSPSPARASAPSMASTPTPFSPLPGGRPTPRQATRRGGEAGPFVTTLPPVEGRQD